MSDGQPASAASNRQAGSQAGELTAELVRQVADRVYAMLLRDLRIEQERARPTNRARIRGNGG